MRLAIIGTGLLAQAVLPRLPDWGWSVEAICSTERSRAKALDLANAHSIPAVYTDYSALLAETAVDAVYLTVPNSLHYEMAMQALRSGKNVIVEKPLVSDSRQAEEMARLAKEKGLYLYEAVATAYQPNLMLLKELLPYVGKIRLVTCNYSQYSRRYDAFQAGELPPVFDPAKAGGALMDLNLYNLHWLVGLFGMPEHLEYHANIERGIDTNGVLLLDYNEFHAVSIAAKDCAAPGRCMIQGTEGYLLQNTSANLCGDILLHKNDGSEQTFSSHVQDRLMPAFRAIAEQIKSRDLESCYAMLQRSVQVSKIQTEARMSAGIYFPSDQW